MCGSAQGFLLKQSVCWGLIKSLTPLYFVLSCFSSVSNICSHNPPPIYSSHHVSRHFDFSVPAQLPESLGSGNHGSDELTSDLLQKTHILCPCLLLSRGTVPCEQPKEGLLLAPGTCEEAAVLYVLGRARWLSSPLGSGTAKGQSSC